MQEHFIICVPWGEQSVASEKFNCCFCNAKVAIDARNVPTLLAANASPVCMYCASVRFKDEPSEAFRSLYAGIEKPMPESLVERFRELHKKVN